MVMSNTQMTNDLFSIVSIVLLAHCPMHENLTFSIQGDSVNLNFLKHQTIFSLVIGKSYILIVALLQELIVFSLQATI